MNCPNCGVMNDANNQFCQNCGKSLVDTSPDFMINRSKAAKDILLSHSFRFLISVFSLWIIKATLTSLSFVKELYIPDFPISIVVIISLVILVILIALIIGYGRVISTYWPEAFPKYHEANSLWIAIIGLILLGCFYKLLKPLISLINFDTSSTSSLNSNTYEPILILQLVLLAIAVVIVFQAAASIYYAIPKWYQNIREEWFRLQKN